MHGTSLEEMMMRVFRRRIVERGVRLETDLLLRATRNMRKGVACSVILECCGVGSFGCMMSYQEDSGIM